MNPFIKKNWGIDVKSIKEFKQGSPLNTKKFYIINKEYFLKSDLEKYQAEMEKDLQLQKKLTHYNVKTLNPLMDEFFKNKGWIFAMYPLLESQSPDLDSMKLAKNISNCLNSILEVKLSEEKQSIRQIIKGVFDCHENVNLRNAGKILEKNLFPFLKYFNLRFSHGDLHPDNIIIRDFSVEAVLDWDKAAYREEYFDLAFLVGCIGINDPLFLLSDFVKTILKDIKSPNKLGFQLLPEMILATRCIWFYKWVCLKDQEMITLESDYIEILNYSLNKIRRIWLSYIENDYKASKYNWVFQDKFMVDDIKKAKTKLKDPFKININEIKEPEELITNLRLWQIEFGTKEDLINVLKLRNTIEDIADLYPSNHVLIESLIAKGNSCLDLTKFNLKDAIEMTLNEAETLIDDKKIKELYIGYSFMLRNASIAYAEDDDFEKMHKCLEKFQRIKALNIKIKGEYARALSNAITSLIPNFVDLDKYWSELKELDAMHPKDRKINGAYLVAKNNLEKVGYLNISPNRHFI